MTEYALTRAQSTAVIRGSAIDNQPTLMLTRTYSVPDVNAYHRFTDPYKPQWCIYRYPFPQYKQYFPYRYYRDNYLAENSNVNAFWYNKYYRFTPLYNRSRFRRLFHHRYDFDNPSYSKRAYDPYYTPFYDAYSYGNWADYRSHVI